MAHHQTRRSVSLSAHAHAALERYCAAREVPVSRFVEFAVADAIAAGKVPPEREPRPGDEGPAPTVTLTIDEAAASRHRRHGWRCTSGASRLPTLTDVGARLSAIDHGKVHGRRLAFPAATPATPHAAPAVAPPPPARAPLTCRCCGAPVRDDDCGFCGACEDCYPSRGECGASCPRRAGAPDPASVAAVPPQSAPTARPEEPTASPTGTLVALAPPPPSAATSPAPTASAAPGRAAATEPAAAPPPARPVPNCSSPALTATPRPAIVAPTSAPAATAPARAPDLARPAAAETPPLPARPKAGGPTPPGALPAPPANLLMLG